MADSIAPRAGAAWIEAEMEFVLAEHASSKTAEAKRLDTSAWIDAALDLLAVHGIDGVRVEVLAKQLAITKGSFYWHFKDRDALHAAMLNQWRRLATIQLIERLDKTGVTPKARMRLLLRLPMTGRRSAAAADVELAIRLWGRRDARARDALAEVDQLRLRYIAQLLVECGVPPADGMARATLAYSYLRVAATLIPVSAVGMMQQCEDLLIGRR